MKPEIYRSKAAWVLGWLWMAFAAANALDLLVRGSMPSALIAGAMLGAVTVLVFLMALRPAVLLEQGGVRVRNPLRNAYVPWRAVDDVVVTSAIVIESGNLTVRCWTPQATARERAKAARRAAKTLASAEASSVERTVAQAAGARTHADWVAERITELRRTRQDDSSGQAAVTWSPTALAVLAAGVALVVVAVVLA